MTENEAIERFQECVKNNGKCEKCNFFTNCGIYEMEELAIQALEEVQQYRQIGSVEEFREAVEKQTAKKVTSFDYHNGTVNYGCPICKRKIISKIDGKWCGGTFNEYCDRCGQKLDWSDEDGKTD